MIIVSRLHQNVSVKFGDDKVIFKNAEAEVSDEIGKRIIANHPKDIWEKNKRPVAEVKKKDVDPIENVKELESQLRITKQRLTESEDKLKLSQTESQAWKDLVNKRLPEGESISLPTPHLLDNDIETIVNLMGKTPAQLKDYCKNLEFPEVDWTELTKNKLVIYISKKTLNNANT